MKNNPVYNTIGKTYDSTRTADPEITQTLIRLLQLKENGRYLDIACGSGNYTHALHQAGIAIEGIDISEEMLSKALAKSAGIRWQLGDATHLPFENGHFDGAICTLATHHISDKELAFTEAFRVINTGNFVLLTCTPEQIKDCWLQDYFPQMLDDGKRFFSSYETLEAALQKAGFCNIHSLPFLVTNTLTDHFLYTGKHRPEIYLDPAIRAGISSFHLSDYGNEIRDGLDRLKRDIDTGKIKEIMAAYESKNGDYLFVVGQKN